MPKWTGFTPGRLTSSSGASAQSLANASRALQSAGEMLTAPERTQIGLLQREQDMQQRAIENQMAQDKFALDQEKFGQLLATQARSDFTQNVLADMQKLPTVADRREYLGRVQKESGGLSFAPQDQKTLTGLLTTPAKEYEATDMYRYDPAKDQVVSVKPRTAGEEEQYRKAGYNYGQFTRGRKDDGSGSTNDKGSILGGFGSSKYALQLVDKVGSWDANKAIDIGSKLQYDLGLKDEEVANLLDLATGNWIGDNQVKEAKLSKALNNAGLTKDVVDEEGKPASAKQMAATYFNPNLELRFNPETKKRVIVDLKKEAKILKARENTKNNILPTRSGGFGANR